MRLVEFFFYHEPTEKFGTRIAVNPEYVVYVTPHDDSWVTISLEGWTRPVYANLSYDRFVADLQR